MTDFIYAGTFDCITNGHLDIIKRASKLCNNLIIAVPKKSNKNTMFELGHRLDFIKMSLAELNLHCYTEVVTYDGLTADLVDNNQVLIRGIRGISDLDYELSLSHINDDLNNVETLLIPCKNEYSHISSSLVRELIKTKHNSLSKYIPNPVYDWIINSVWWRIAR